MKRFLSLSFLLFSWMALGCSYQPPTTVNEMLLTLDHTIAEKNRYDNQREKQIANIKKKLIDVTSPFKQYQIFNELFLAYNKFQLDSALRYVSQKQALALSLGKAEQEETRMNQADLLCTMGMYKEALDILDTTQREWLHNDQIPYYYHLYRTVYGAMGDYALTEPEKKKYYALTDVYRDSILQANYPQSLTYKLVATERMIFQKEYQQALSILNESYETCLDMHGKGLIAYNLSQVYEGVSNRDKQIYHLAASAVIDLKLPIKEYLSLIKLAILLFEGGDIDRAYKYLNCAMEDAVACNARLRTLEITEIYPIVDKAYQQREAKNKQVRLVFTVCISLLSVILIISMVCIYRQMKKLREARQSVCEMNDRLTDINRELSTSNQIKQEYITHYLDQCTLYLDKLEAYRRSLANLAMASKINELFKAIKSDRFIEEERAKFYREFDQTFLHLFPHFVESFNNLLVDEGKIYPKPGELLCTEIRIFALIRLGISDSTQIARFLRYSLTTIYNYRSKVRNKAKGEKNHFEQAIMQIDR